MDIKGYCDNCKKEKLLEVENIFSVGKKQDIFETKVMARCECGQEVILVFINTKHSKTGFFV